LGALHTFNRKFVSPQELAEQACHIEVDILQEPIGKQDQYIAAFGGITSFEFLPDGQVNVTPLSLPSEALANLEDNLLLFFTGTSRSASEILRDQDMKSKENGAQMLDNLHFTKQLGVESRDALVKGDLRKFAELMAVHWEHKKKRSPGMSNGPIDSLYELARKNGALGGKIVGAGGGGFLLLYTEQKTRVREAMRGAGLREVRLGFDFAGTSVVVHS
jgi:D-glycero-alpha-D-manno-heptose-7-phosphate kinase